MALKRVTMCVLAVLVLASLVQLVPAMEIDLRSGASSALPDGMMWHSELTNNTKEYACDRQGVLKLTFDPKKRRVASITMTFEDSEGYTFNLGDSATNDGFGGDSNTQENNAELHSHGSSIFFYSRKNRGVGSYSLQHSEANYVAITPSKTITFEIRNERVTADNGKSFLYFDYPDLFALGGQSDSSGGVNYDVYLGMNRVVGTSKQSGIGLCKVSVKFYST